jgi:MFS family permease
MRNIPRSMSSLFWTQFYGALNDNLFKNALIILITYKMISLFGLSSGMLVAFCGGIFILPFFLFSATAGQLADKFEKSWLVVRIKECEMGIALLGALGLILHNYPLMLVVLFLLGLQATFFGPLKYSLIPHYSSKDQLVFSNALISSGTFCAILMGTILGGVAASFQDNLWPLIILLLGFSFLGLFYAWRLPKVQPEEKAKVMVDWNLFTSTRDILKIALKNQRIFVLILGLSWFWFLGAGLLSILPMMAKDIFNGNENVATLMLFTFVIGMGIGPFVLEKIFKGRVPRWVIPVSLILLTMMLFDVAFAMKSASNQSFLLSLLPAITPVEFFKLNMSTRTVVGLFLMSMFGGMFTVSQFTELQRITPDEELSRVVAANNIVNALMMVSVSILLMFLHKQHFPLHVIIVILGMLNIGMCLVLLFYYKEEFNKFWGF